MNKLQNANNLPLWVQWAIFLVILLLVSWYYDFHKILFLGPQSVHFWRQVDCLSFTLNYMMEDRAFFNPAIHYIAAAGHGEVVTDFPVIFYLVGNIWKITGQQEWIYRLIVFLLFTSGISFLFFALKGLAQKLVLGCISFIVAFYISGNSLLFIQFCDEYACVLFCTDGPVFFLLVCQNREIQMVMAFYGLLFNRRTHKNPCPDDLYGNSVYIPDRCIGYY